MGSEPWSHDVLQQGPPLRVIRDVRQSVHRLASRGPTRIRHARMRPGCPEREAPAIAGLMSDPGGRDSSH
jgi:hypothetical protein